MKSAQASILAILVLAYSACWTAVIAEPQFDQTPPDSSSPSARVVPLQSGQPTLSRQAFEYFTNGLLYEGMEDYPRAAASYEKALSFHPEEYELRRSYAEMLVQLRQPMQALTVLDSIQPIDEPVLDLRASALRQMGNDSGACEQYLALVKLDSLDQGALIFLASYYQRRGNIDSTIWAYSRLRLVQPGNYQLLNELGRLQVMDGNTATARETFKRSLEVTPFPTNPQAFFSLAELYDLSKQTDSVIWLLEDGLEKDPNNISLHNELVTLYVRAESLPSALPHMRAIARINSGDAETSRRLAMLYLGLDSLAQADSIFSDLVGRGLSTYTDHYSLGMIAAVSEDMPRAKVELRRALQLDNTKLDAWLNLAAVYNDLNQVDSARSVYLEGAERMRDEASAVQLYFALGASLEQSDKVDSAIAVFEEILTHQPDHDQTLNYLGYMLADRSLQLEHARDLIKRALTLQPNSAAYLDSYGWVHYRLGDYDSAVVYLKSASELDSDPVILEHLGDAYQAKGEVQKAREVWEAVLQQQPDNQTVREKLGR